MGLPDPETDPRYQWPAQVAAAEGLAGTVVSWFEEGLTGGQMDQCCMCEASEPPHEDGCPVPVAEEWLTRHHSASGQAPEAGAEG